MTGLAESLKPSAQVYDADVASLPNVVAEDLVSDGEYRDVLVHSSLHLILKCYILQYISYTN